VYRLDEASRAVATLAGVGETIPNPHLLVRPFMRREAVLSSRIEGTQASLSDLYLYEASKQVRGDVLEVRNYVSALDEGIELLEKLPISLRLINRLHASLLTGVRGQQRRPGEIRDMQVWIGAAGTPVEEARFVPPPPSHVLDAMTDWERFANEDLQMPPLVQCALLHYQFEAIHPYFDGNGRIGRLLIVLFLCARGVLSVPLLYLSAYFERDRQAYYDQLLDVSATGDWSAWLRYFLEGVIEQAHDSLTRTRQIRDLYDTYRDVLLKKRITGNATGLVDLLFVQPYMTAPFAAAALNITNAGARKILERLVEVELIDLIPDTWPRLFVAQELVEIIAAPEAKST
jgi:Fic family protein